MSVSNHMLSTQSLAHATTSKELTAFSRIMASECMSLHFFMHISTFPMPRQLTALCWALLADEARAHLLANE